MSANSNREALRRLSRKHPPPDDVEKIILDLHKSTDMHAAIISTAIVEGALEDLIKARFVSKDKNLEGQLFLNRGPLMDFHSKILIAHAFGILTGPQAEELHSLKSIRNAFAHSRTPISFDHEIVNREIQSLKMVIAMKATPLSHSAEITNFDLPNKAWFLLVAKILLIMIDQVKEHGGTADAALGEALG